MGGMKMDSASMVSSHFSATFAMTFEGLSFPGRSCLVPATRASPGFCRLPFYVGLKHCSNTVRMNHIVSKQGAIHPGWREICQAGPLRLPLPHGQTAGNKTSRSHTAFYYKI
jgi:hypothetical protein